MERDSDRTWIETFGKIENPYGTSRENREIRLSLIRDSIQFNVEKKVKKYRKLAIDLVFLLTKILNLLCQQEIFIMKQSEKH